MASLTRNVDYVASLQLRRSGQWVRFYSDLWSKEKLKDLLVQMGKRLVHNHYKRRGVYLLGGTAVCQATSPSPVKPPKAVKCSPDAAAANENGGSSPSGSSGSQSQQRPEVHSLIPDELMLSHVRDLDYAHKLTRATLTCEDCQKRHLIDQQIEGVEYCACPSRKSSVYGTLAENCDDSDTCWAPFLERKDVIVWRREHPDHRGLYAYKMYGKFDDVTAREFLEVQMDLSEFRLQWDISTAQCHIISQDEVTSSSEPTSDFASDLSQLYYWEVNWPRFFSNRDYVCARRAVIIEPADQENAGNSNSSSERRIVVYSKNAHHSSYPEKAKTFRVQDYVSVLTIKPFETFDAPGIEFSLTAFENPGLSLPSSITTWVALRAMPEFMLNLRKACLEMRKWKGEASKASDDATSVTTPAKEPPYIETPKQAASSPTSSPNKANKAPSSSSSSPAFPASSSATKTTADSNAYA